MKSIWLVMGQDFSDDPVSPWVVAAYPDSDVAALHAQMADEAAIPPEDEVEKEEWDDLTNPFDSTYENGMVEADYFTVEIPFYLHPDEYLERKESQDGR